MIETIYFLIVMIYGLTFAGLFMRSHAITILGCFGMFALAIYILVNGIASFNNFVTDIFGVITLGVAMYVSVKTVIEFIQENYD